MPQRPVAETDAKPAEDEQSDWTFVKPKSRRGKQRPSNNTRFQALAIRTKSPTTLQRTVAEIEAEFRKIKEDWEQSPCCTEIRNLVKDQVSSQTSVKKAVCLGIGTFDPADGAWNAKRRTYIQLIAFLTMVEELRKQYEKDASIPCVFQEPLFTESDKGFVTKLGHTVVESPEACEGIDEEALLFAVHLYRPIYAMALANSLPAIFVGTGWDVWDSINSTEAQDLAPIETMHEGFHKRTFPQEGNAFTSTSIYWKPSPSPEKPDMDSKKMADGSADNVTPEESQDATRGIEP